MKTTFELQVVSVVAALALATGLMAITGCDRNAQNKTGSEPNPANEPSRTVGETVDDTALAAKVKAELVADPMKFSDVNVKAYKGVVQLSGFTETEDQKSHAAELAGKVANVTKVENNITLKPAATP